MNNNILNQLETRPDLIYLLFRRGWAVSKKPIRHPLLKDWKHEEAHGWHFMWHPDAHYTINSDGYFIMGHSYNPFSGEYDEAKQLNRIADADTKEERISRIDELTGVFVLGQISDDKIHFITDPSGMQSAYYGAVEDNFVITSHTQLIADVYGLEMAPIVKELINYKWYPRVMGCYLPADLTPNEELRRVIPNIEYTYDGKNVSHYRFYPLKDIKEVSNTEEYYQVIKEAADILKKGADLVLKKWKRPAISLTGGIDSNTTFAAANGHYTEYETFSYLSAPKEVPDVDAAQKIADRFKTHHTIYKIPDNNDDITDFDLKATILRHNSGYIALRKENELRKRIYLEEHCKNDVEVKSWVSETIRAYWYKHYGRRRMPRLSPKLFRNLYKIFIGNRVLAHKIDKIFAQYIKEFEYEKIPEQYPAADMHYNEVTWGSWGGLNISEMKYCFDITFLYNNRKFLDLLFRIPLEDRISDRHHLEMKKYLNPELHDMGIRVVNMAETDRRARLLNIVFTANMMLPF